MSSNVLNPVDREIRFVLTEPIPAVVNVQPDNHRLADEIYAAELIDLSQSGVKLCADNPIQSDRSVRIKITVDDLGMEFYVAGSVCWSRSSDDGKWLVGCSLRPGFPARLLERLAAFSDSDRRETERGPDDSKLFAKLDSDDEWFEVDVQNFARGGVCILSNRKTMVGSRMSLRFHELSMSTTAQWQMTVDDKFLVGCTFSNEHDATVLEETMQKAQTHSVAAG